MQPTSDTSTPVGAELLSDAKNFGSSAANHLYNEADARKGEAVRQAQAVSSTIERAADDLDATAPSWLKSALEQGAQQVKSFAGTLDQSDSRQMVAQIGAFAKRSPGTFLGACAVAGFAAARIFKAGSNINTPSQMASVSPLESMPMTSPNLHATSNNMSSSAPSDGLV